MPPMFHVAELILAHILQNRGSLAGFGGKLRAFGDNHDGKVAAALVTLADGVGNFVDIEGAFGNEDDVGAAGDTAVKSDPTRVAAHDLYDHDAVVSFGGSVDAVEGFTDDVAGGVESKGVIGAAKIVVDGFRDADDFSAAFVELLRNRKSVIAADGDEGVDPIFLEGDQATVDAILALGGIGAGSARKMVPPRGRMPPTASRLRGMVSSSIRPRQPSMKPMNSSS